MSAGWWRRQDPVGRHVPARSGPVVRPGRWCPHRLGAPPFRLGVAPCGSPVLPRPPVEGGPHREAAISACVAAPGSTAVPRTAPHLDALYALAYLHSHDDDTARQAVADALGSVRHDLDTGTSIGRPAGWAGLWRALADHLHRAYTVDPGETGMLDDDARRAVGVLRFEAIALYAGGCTESHAASLLGVPRPVVRRLRRAPGAD